MRLFTKIMFGLAAGLAILVFLASCAFRNPIDAAPAYVGGRSAQTATIPPSPNMHMSILVTATVMAPEAIMFEGGSWLKSRKMGHSAILICHPKALLIFDTGLGREIDTQFKSMPAWQKPFFTYDIIAPAIEQLDSAVFCPESPTQIILSHLHWDHASGIEDFANAPVWTPPAELASGRKLKNRSGYLANQFDSPAIDWRSLDFADIQYMNYTSSLDFFGDGRVILVPMNGHTEGAVGMFVNLGPERRYFFTGDTTWSVEGFARPAHKHALMRAIVDGDVDATEEEIRRVNALMQNDPDLNIIPAHDFEAYPPEAIYPAAIATR